MIAELIPPAWAELLAETAKPYFPLLDDFVSAEYARGQVAPQKNEIFAALARVAPADVKVVILGQDPYPGAQNGALEACGLAFVTRAGLNWSQSLRRLIGARADADPQRWAEQGVLLLNTVLTTRVGESNSHANHGWENFTRQIMRIVARDKTVVWLLLGKPAKGQVVGIDVGPVINCYHPSPLSRQHFDREVAALGWPLDRVNAQLATLGKAGIKF